MAGGDAWIHHMWSGDFLYLREGVVKKPDELRLRGAQGRHADQLRRLRDPHQRASTPAPRCSSSTTCSGPRTRRRTWTTSSTRSRCGTPCRASTTWSRTCPACNVDVKDLENPDVFRLLERRRGAAARGHVDRSEGELMATAGHPPDGPESRPPARARPAHPALGRAAGAADRLDRRLLRHQHGHRRAALLRPHPGATAARSSAPAPATTTRCGTRSTCGCSCARSATPSPPT